MEPCPFCSTVGVVLAPAWQWVSDKFPVSEGHGLVVPKRHVETLFDLTEDELKQLGPAIAKAGMFAEIVSSCMHGFNVGINHGRAAGQTVPHLHIHFIPRRRGDVPDPAGGVRGVIPHKRTYQNED